MASSRATLAAAKTASVADAAAKPRMRATAMMIRMFATLDVRSEASAMRLANPVARISTPLISMPDESE